MGSRCACVGFCCLYNFVVAWNAEVHARCGSQNHRHHCQSTGHHSIEAATAKLSQIRRAFAVVMVTLALLSRGLAASGQAHIPSSLKCCIKPHEVRSCWKGYIAKRITKNTCSASTYRTADTVCLLYASQGLRQEIQRFKYRSNVSPRCIVSPDLQFVHVCCVNNSISRCAYVASSEDGRTATGGVHPCTKSPPISGIAHPLDE